MYGTIRWKEDLVSIAVQHNTFKIEFWEIWFQHKNSVLRERLVFMLEIAKIQTELNLEWNKLK